MSLQAAIVLLSSLPQASAQEAKPTHAQLRVAFVGKPGTERTKAFADFLAAKFGKVEVADRHACDPKDFGSADVVVLDWPQQEGVIQWMNNRENNKGNGRELKITTPLGDRESWSKPTVLIGSAGLNLAGAWSVKGGSG